MTTKHSSHAPNTRGHILLLVLVFTGILTTVGAALVSYLSVYGRWERAVVTQTQALALAEGALDIATAKLNQDLSYTGEADTPLGNGSLTITVTAIDNKTKRIIATGYVPNSQYPTASKTVSANVGISDAVISFRYAIQAGNGGFVLNNSSQITGNVFSSGPVIGNNNNDIYGDVISADSSGTAYGIHATGSVYAHTLGKAGNSTRVDKNAYYVTKTNTTVSGTSYPNSTDQTVAPLPISDEQIAAWETEAAGGGIISSCDGSGNYTITTSVSLGPVKILCNVIVKSSSGILTVTGPIWVAGNITTQTGPTIKIAPALGNQNVAIIADKPSAPSASGLIDIGQSTIFQGSGSPNSFVFLISQNRAAEGGASTPSAITMGQGASALVAYAIHGLITMTQSVSVKEATGYKINLSQSANIVYDTGLPSTVFQSGPGGSWSFVPGTYSITP